QNIQIDKGREWLNQLMKSYLKKENIHYYSVESELKCCVIERFNRTFMTRVARYMTHKNTEKFVHLLPDFVRSYNDTYHSSIKMSPSSVSQENWMQVWENLYNDYDNKFSKPLFAVGDKVLISITKNIFEKGYAKGFQSEIFTVYKIGNTYPRMYYIRD